MTIQVLLSSYNGEKYIKDQILSIMQQETESSVHLLIRDDGSTDGTCSVVEELQAEFPGRIELIRGENIGSNASFFWLIENAPEADFYALSDQDDVWLPDKLQVAVNSLEKEDANLPLLFGCTSHIVDDLKPTGMTRKQVRPLTVYNTMVQNLFPGHNQVFNNTLRKMLYDVNASRVYVYDYWILNVATIYGKIIFSNEPHTLYRQHAGNQLGYGSTDAGKLATVAKHASQGKSRLMRMQIEHFAEKNAARLRELGYYDEIIHFLNADSFPQRFAYALTTKFYRQSIFESLALRAGILVGAFKKLI